MAKRLMEKEVLTRFVFAFFVDRPLLTPFREDMIDLLGKRPFSGKDDMDKWLDEHGSERKKVPLPIPDADANPLPEPSVAVKTVDPRT